MVGLLAWAWPGDEAVAASPSRVVAWLPDMPADLRWMRGLLRNLVLKVYSRTKDQLLGPGR